MSFNFQIQLNTFIFFVEKMNKHHWFLFTKTDSFKQKNQSESKKIKRYFLMNSTFVQFHNQKATYMERQCRVWCMLMTLQSHYFEASAMAVKWNSLFLTRRSRYFRALLTVGAVAMIILAWSVPVALTGFMSQLISGSVNSSLTDSDNHHIDWLLTDFCKRY